MLAPKRSVSPPSRAGAPRAEHGRGEIARPQRPRRRLVTVTEHREERASGGNCRPTERVYGAASAGQRAWTGRRRPWYMSFMADGATHGYSWSDAPEPHIERRRALLAAHPEIRELFGPCPRTKYVCTLLVGLQLSAA